MGCVLYSVRDAVRLYTRYSIACFNLMWEKTPDESLHKWMIVEHLLVFPTKILLNNVVQNGFLCHSGAISPYSVETCWISHYPIPHCTPLHPTVLA